MAEKRMFTKQIIDTDAFLRMPLSAQALYFHFNMRADDDGFVDNPKSLTEYVHASEDDLRLLIAKRFIIAFDSGVIVIKHWRMHNTLKSDRYNPTAYQEEFAQLGIKPNKSYTLLSDHVEPEWNQNGTNVEPQNRIGLDLEKNSNNTYGAKEPRKSETSFDKFWAEYPRKVGKEAARRAFAKVKVPVDTLLAALQQQKASEQWKRGYIPNPATWLNQGRWEDEVETQDKPRRPFVPTVF